LIGGEVSSSEECNCGVSCKDGVLEGVGEIRTCSCGFNGAGSHGC